MSDREQYQKAITEIIENIERLDILVYLHRLIGNIIKAGI